MAQVKKFQNAPGNLPEKEETSVTPKVKNLGKLTINNHSLEGQSALDAIQAAYASAPITRRGMGEMANTMINDGHEVIYDPLSNTIKAIDKDGYDVTDQYINTVRGGKASPNDSKLRRNLGATFHTDRDEFKRSGSYLASIDAAPKLTEETAVLTPLLNGGNKWFDYEQKDGKNHYREGDINNYYLDIMNKALDYAVDPRENSELDKIYSYEGWTPSGRTSLRNFGRSITDPEGLKARLLSEIKDGSIYDNPQDLAILKMVGLAPEEVEATTPSESTPESLIGTIPTGWEGNPDALKSMKIGIQLGDDGKYHIIGNDSFINENWYLGGLSPFEGTPYADGFAINGTLYSIDDIYNDPSVAPYVSQFIGGSGPDTYYGDWYSSANEAPVRFYGDRKWVGKEDATGIYSDYNPQEYYIPGLYEYFTKTHKIGKPSIRDISGEFSGLGNGLRVVSYTDGITKNRAGVLTPNYLVMDGDRVVGEFNDRQSLMESLGNEVTLNPFASYGNSFVRAPWENGFANYGELVTSRETDPQTNTLKIDRFGNIYIDRFQDKRGDHSIKVDPSNIEYLMGVIRGDYDASNKDIEHFNKPNYFATRNVSKHQYGGSLYSSAFSTKNSIKEGKHDILSDHTISTNGQSSGLTESEKLQLGAAIADLASVGMMFTGPVGLAAGAATGIGASTARFVGDIRQDGYQGKDLRKYLTGIGFNTLALAMPQIAAAKKMESALQVIKGVGSVVMPILAAKGATNTAKLLGKVIAGEKVNSEELTGLFTDLSAIVLGTGSAVGTVKEAKALAQNAAKNVESYLNTAKTATIGETTISKTGKEISEFANLNKSERMAIEAIQADAKKAGVTLDEAQAKKALSDLGIKFEKGSIGGKKADGSRSLFSRGDNKTVVSGNPKAEGTLKYIVNPRARYQAGKGIAGSITNEQLKEAQEILMSGKETEGMTLADAKLINNLANTMPSNFQEGVLKVVTTPNGAIQYPISNSERALTLGGRRYYRERLRKPYTQPSAQVEEVEEYIPKTSWKGTKIKYLAPTTEYVQDPYDMYIPERTRLEPIKEVYNFPFEEYPYTNSAHDMRMPKSPYMVDMPLSTARTYGNGISAIEYLAFKNGGKVPSFASGGAWGEAIKPKLATAADIMQGVVNAGAIHKSYDWQRAANNKLYGKQFVVPTLQTNSLYTGDIERAVEQAKEPYKKLKFATSDNFANLAGNLSKAESLSQIEQNGNSQISNRIVENNRERVATSNQQSQLEANAATQRSSNDANVAARADSLNAAEIEDKFANVYNTLSQQLRQQLRDRENALYQLDYEQTANDAQTNFTKVKDNLFKDLKAEWEISNSGLSFDSWVAKYKPNELYKIQNSKTYKDALATLNNTLFDAKRALTKATYSKEGGSIPYQKRTVSEAHAINGDQAAKRAVRQMSSDLAKMLLQLMKI